MATFQKSKHLEAALELGRNWALATTVSVASLSLLSVEGIYRTARHSQHMAAVGVVLSLGWYGLSALRAFQVAEFAAKDWRQRSALSLLIVFLYVTGLGLMIFVGQMAKNQRFVEICATYETRVDTAVHADPICQRLYQLRREQKMRLEAAN